MNTVNTINTPNDSGPLMACRQLSIAFPASHGPVTAVESIDLGLDRGEVVGIVGESGCGKSLTALALMGLLPEPGYLAGGSIHFDGQRIDRFSDRQMQSIRGNRMAMIFQEPMTALNPTHRIGRQLMEPMRLHRHMDRDEAYQQALAALTRVGIPAPERRMAEYPHQLSGGMRQRVMIAMAIVCDPVLLIADEPTTALDVTIQAQILDLLEALVRDRQMASLFITHDLGVVAEICRRVVVMYAGRIVESAPVADLFADPKHPYTRGLMASIPRIDERMETLYTIPGVVPGIHQFPRHGCRFAPRCDRRMDRCETITPQSVDCAPDHQVACHLYPGEEGQ